MSYISKGKRPNEWASKSSHSHVINDSSVQDFLSKCKLPTEHANIELHKGETLFDFEEKENSIKHVIAVDGGYTEVVVRKNFPASKVAFFQFGALFFSLEQLAALSDKPFIAPEDMAKFKNLERFKLVLPIRHVAYMEQGSLTKSVRKVIYDFFMTKTNGTSFMETLAWFIYQDYEFPSSPSYKLDSDPNDSENKGPIEFARSAMKSDFTFDINGGVVYLTDVFRLHEAIDDELGASGILGYVTTLIEQIIIIHYIKYLLEKQPEALKKIMFIKDGPLAFFGQTARLHKKMRCLINYLWVNHDLYLVGLEKSGAFVDHADEISKIVDGDSKLKAGQVLLLSNDYIYKYIIPGEADDSRPYASTSYYSSKIIFKTNEEKVYVATIPVKNDKVVLKPSQKDFQNLDAILANIAKLKCDMYDNSLVPIALVNQLVSLAHHPSSVLLEKFAKHHIL